MRVLKFGRYVSGKCGTFYSVLLTSLRGNARQGQVATVLSAPAKITNYLVAMIEKTVAGQDILRS